MQRNIRSLASVARALPDWTIFNDCFPNTSIRISDIDGVVERHGRFLFIEKKPVNGSIPFGQDLMYRRLVEASDRFTVIVLFTEEVNDVAECDSGDVVLVSLSPMNIKRIGVYRRAADGSVVYTETPTTTNKVKRAIRDWYARVNAQARRIDGNGDAAAPVVSP